MRIFLNKYKFELAVLHDHSLSFGIRKSTRFWITSRSRYAKNNCHTLDYLDKTYVYVNKSKTERADLFLLFICVVWHKQYLLKCNQIRIQDYYFQKTFFLFSSSIYYIELIIYKKRNLWETSYCDYLNYGLQLYVIWNHVQWQNKYCSTNNLE